MQQQPPSPATPTGSDPSLQPASERGSRTTWGAWEVLAGIAISIVIVSVVGGITLAIVGEEGIGATLAIQAVLDVTLIAVAFGFARSGREVRPVAEQLGLTGFGLRAVGLAVLAFLGYIFLSGFYVEFVAQPEQENIADELGFDQGTGGAIAAGVLIVGVAPVFEEIFFRSFVYGGLRESMPVWLAMIISGGLFGAVHFGPGNAAVVGQLAILGVILAWLYERTGSIGPPILLHLINNAIAFSVLVSS